jgi:hypothetical protein
MTTRTTPRTTFIVLVVPVVLVLWVLPLPFSLLRVRISPFVVERSSANIITDSKQARDLVQILTESKQQIDPRLHEMARYGGGGGGGGRWGGGRGRGGGRGGGGRGGRR